MERTVELLLQAHLQQAERHAKELNELQMLERHTLRRQQEDLRDQHRQQQATLSALMSTALQEVRDGVSWHAGPLAAAAVAAPAHKTVENFYIGDDVEHVDPLSDKMGYKSGSNDGEAEAFSPSARPEAGDDAMTTEESESEPRVTAEVVRSPDQPSQRCSALTGAAAASQSESEQDQAGDFGNHPVIASAEEAPRQHQQEATSCLPRAEAEPESAPDEPDAPETGEDVSPAGACESEHEHEQPAMEHIESEGEPRGGLQVVQPRRCYRSARGSTAAPLSQEELDRARRSPITASQLQQLRAFFQQRKNGMDPSEYEYEYEEYERMMQAHQHVLKEDKLLARRQSRRR